MKPIVCALLLLVSTVIRSRVSLQLEIVALRHQLAVYQRTAKRPQISSGDRILWSWLLRHWSGWRDALVFVQTGTVIAWQHLARLSGSCRRVKRSLFETNPDELFQLLSSLAHASVAGNG